MPFSDWRMMVDSLGDVVAHQGRKPDAQVDHVAVVEHAGDALGDILFVGLRIPCRPPYMSSFSALTMKSTKIDAVWTSLGSISPISTSSSTSATTSLAAVAIMGVEVAGGSPA